MEVLAVTYHGGAGIDTVSYAADAPGYIGLYLLTDGTGQGYDLAHYPGWGSDSYFDIENVDGSAFDD